jgi:hypothetical protein
VDLTDLERRILAFERRLWTSAGGKAAAIKAEFDMSATRYQQLVNALIDRPEALVAEPMLVKRLLRLRATRRKERRTG